MERGFGEILIGFCYGWLPVATGYYLQRGTVIPAVHWTSLPIALTIFNVILINEFPDFPADSIVGKRNLVVRFGKPRTARLYVTASLGAVGLFALSLAMGIPLLAGLFYLPAAAISLAVSFFMLRGKYYDRKHLEIMCGLTLGVNLATIVAYILGVLYGRAGAP